MERQTKIKVEAAVNAPVEKVWQQWNAPADIMQWNAADPSWHCPSSQNDLRVNGTFKNRMEAKDGSFGFDLKELMIRLNCIKKSPIPCLMVGQ
ncbi:SRPBCC domain-containing protein [Sphingobacterium sp. E70]|uniref:SRPBCC domain-containing protein n=1 Tax=Sphingobacterium sp. E70 TaxID=2853439 RepID=UPI002795715F|nr:SRPBCC domain-containing protein [Sphingobacterium sp. E70]